MYKKFMLKAFLLFLASPLALFAAEPLNLKKYQPKNSDEEGIKQVLLDYVEAWNNYDRKGILSCFQEGAKFMCWPSPKTLSRDDISNASLKEIKPYAWYGFYDPKINIEADKAVVNATLMTGRNIVEHIVYMVRGTNTWLIMKVEFKNP